MSAVCTPDNTQPVTYVLDICAATTPSMLMTPEPCARRCRPEWPPALMSTIEQNRSRYYAEPPAGAVNDLVDKRSPKFSRHTREYRKDRESRTSSTASARA